MAQTKIVINYETGVVLVEAIGYTGTNCVAATQPYEEALGEACDRTPKPEAMNVEVTTTQTQQLNLM